MLPRPGDTISYTFLTKSNSRVSLLLPCLSVFKIHAWIAGNAVTINVGSLIDVSDLVPKCNCEGKELQQV